MTIAHFHVSDKKNKGDVAIVDAVQELLRNEFPDCSILDYSIEQLRDGVPDTTLADINNADAVVIGGGGIYYRYFLPYNRKLITAIKPPIFIVGVGYIRELGSTEMSKDEVDSVIALNKKAALVSCRDYYTAKWLEKYGVAESNIHIIGDPAVLLSERKPNLEIKDSISIGVNLNYSGWLGFGTYEKEIIDSYNEVIAYFESLGGQCYYLQHHPDEARIFDRLSSDTMQILDLPTNEQKYMYGTMDIVVGMMLHSVVLAFGAGTPFINVGYDIRNESFTKFIGHPELLLYASDLKKRSLKALTESTYHKRKYYKESFNNKKKEIQKAHDNFFTKMSSLIS